MGFRVRFAVASVMSLAGALVPLVACDDGPMYDPAYPIEGGPTVRPTKDVNVPEIVQPQPEAAVEAGTCDPLGPPIDVLKIAEDPNDDPIGGVVPEGTYKLTRAVYADGSDAGGVAFKRAASIKFTGKNVVWHFDTDDDGKPKPTCCLGTWSFTTFVLVMNVSCDGEPAESMNEIYDLYPNGVPDSGADAGAPQLQLHVGALHDIYTKQ